jgi:uncharacterized protein
VNLVFADTFFRIALTNREDTSHEEAKVFITSARPGGILTTEQVLTEYLNYFSSWGPSYRHKISTNVEIMLGNPTTRVVLSTKEIFLAGLRLYRARPDKGFSLTIAFQWTSCDARGSRMP